VRASSVTLLKNSSHYRCPAVTRFILVCHCAIPDQSKHHFRSGTTGSVCTSPLTHRCTKNSAEWLPRKYNLSQPFLSCRPIRPLCILAMQQEMTSVQKAHHERGKGKKGKDENI